MRFFSKPVAIKHLLIASVLTVLLCAGIASAAQGPAGQRGPQGTAGEQGGTGQTGERGMRGLVGKDGKAGKSAPAAAVPSTASSTTSGTSTIDDGTWEVGADIAPGTYRAAGGDLCYWEILKGPPHGDDIDNILENDVASKNVVVTLSQGQWFNTDGCGQWK